MNDAPGAPALGLAAQRAIGPFWVRLVFSFFGFFPRERLPLLGRLIGLFAGGLLRIRRRHVEASIGRAGISEPRLWAGRMYASLGTGLSELFWFGAHPSELSAFRVVIPDESKRALLDALALGRGVVVATAHTGNWDLVGCAVASFLRERGVGFSVVTKRLSWRAMDRVWQGLRASAGVGLIDAKGASKAVIEALRRGEVVAMMVDQVPERRGGIAEFPFLGERARHDLAPMTLAARAGAPIVVAFGRRDGEGGHVVEVVEVIAPMERAGREEIASAMGRVAGRLESFVRAHPADWLWMHRRWKRWGAGLDEEL